VAAAALSLAACADERDRHIGEGVHPVGWASPESPAFHAVWLRANGDDMRRCRTCHGEDYRGGAVGVSCASADCHESEQGPEACGTCHGANPDDPDDPRPETGAHAAHGRFCEECHVVPERVNDELHIGDLEPGPDLRFSGLAVADGAAPTWNAEEKQCSGTYCHVSDAPTWDGEERECSGCHAAPPDSHAQWRDRATEEDCTGCHADPEGETHVDGAVDLELPDGCGACHGDEETGAPPPALSGAVDADQPGVGAHAPPRAPARPPPEAPGGPCGS
jgi:predicted CxxxxCH...CXXCH cytochrome family protein